MKCFFEWGRLLCPAVGNKVSLVVLIQLHLKSVLGEA